ncbi:MAG: hypothetical protein CFE37_06755 [Alphaproteobacteria bacterium PA4]|nr:MAG: hypothetical protein CFE37_06755 [Alphaproteobacteria bacterium PA4]
MTVTLLTAGLLGLLFVILSWQVVQVRQSAQVSLGDGGDALLLGRIRAHANFAEYVPICLILMGSIEVSVQRAPVLLGVAGGVLVIARVAHAIGMAKTGANPYRVIGVLGTWGVLAMLSGWAIVRALAA